MNAYTNWIIISIMLLGTQVNFKQSEKNMCDVGVQCDLIGCNSSAPEPEIVFDSSNYEPEIVSDSENDGNIALGNLDESDYEDQEFSQPSSLSDLK